MKTLFIFTVLTVFPVLGSAATSQCFLFKPNFLQSKNIRVLVVGVPSKTNIKKSALLRLIVKESGILNNDGYVECEHLKTKWYCSIDDDGGSFEFDLSTNELTTKYFNVGSVEVAADGSIEMPTHQPFTMVGSRTKCPRTDN